MKKLLLAIITVLTGYILRERILTEIRVLYLRHKMRVHERETRAQREYLRPPVNLGDSRRSCPTCHESLTYTQSGLGITIRPLLVLLPQGSRRGAASQGLGRPVRREGSHPRRDEARAEAVGQRAPQAEQDVRQRGGWPPDHHRRLAVLGRPVQLGVSPPEGVKLDPVRNHREALQHS